MNWNPFKRKKSIHTDYKSLIVAIMDAYTHSMKFKGVRFAYLIREEEEQESKLIEVAVMIDGKNQTTLFRNEVNSKIVNLNDLWREVFMSITMSGVAGIYNATIQAQNKVPDPAK